MAGSSPSLAGDEPLQEILQVQAHALGMTYVPHAAVTNRPVRPTNGCLDSRCRDREDSAVAWPIAGDADVRDCPDRLRLTCRPDRRLASLSDGRGWYRASGPRFERRYRLRCGLRSQHHGRGSVTGNSGDHAHSLTFGRYA